MKTFDEIMLLADAYADCAEVNGDKPRAALAAALEELIAEYQREAQIAKDDAAFLIHQKLQESQMKNSSWMNCEGVS